MNIRTLLKDRWTFPAAVWSGLLAFTLIWLNVGQRMFHSVLRALTQWDGQHYLSIARDGYQVYPCEFNVNYICGNVGWFPFYPLLAKAVHAVIAIDIRWVVLVVDWLAFLAALLLMYRLIERKFDRRMARVSLLALAVFPTSFYFFAGFPYAVYLLLAVIVFYALETGHYWASVVPSACLAITYPSGLVIGLPLAWHLLSGWRQLAPSRRWALITAILSIGLALFLFAGYYWLQFDDFFLYQTYQSQHYYGHQLSFPFLVLYQSLTSLEPSSPEFIILVFMILLVVLFYSRRIPVGWQLFAFGVLLFTPTFGTTTSYYRQVIVAFPIYAMLALALESKWRRFLLGGYVLAGILLMLTVFFDRFKQSTLM